MFSSVQSWPRWPVSDYVLCEMEWLGVRGVVVKTQPCAGGPPRSGSRPPLAARMFGCRGVWRRAFCPVSDVLGHVLAERRQADLVR